MLKMAASVQKLGNVRPRLFSVCFVAAVVWLIRSQLFEGGRRPSSGSGPSPDCVIRESETVDSVGLLYGRGCSDETHWRVWRMWPLRSQKLESLQ